MAKDALYAKRRLADIGYIVIDGEPMKITIDARGYGYSGNELGKILEENNIYPEFYDSDYLVLMLSADTSARELSALLGVMERITKKNQIPSDKIMIEKPRRAMSIREAMLSPRELVKVEDSLCRVLADGALSCPPAVPILLPGEVVDESAIKAFKYYGYNEILAVK